MRGVRLTSLSPHRDERGRFVEMFRAHDFDSTFVQANHSSSKRGVLRGLHYHRHQADLWYVVRGSARVGLVDLRTRTRRPTVATATLSEDTPASLFIPPGVAHGFYATSDVDLIYWVTALFDATDEYGIAWDDPTIGLDWGTTAPILSERDRANPPLRWQEIPAFS